MASVKLSKELCQAMSHFKTLRRQGEDLQRKIHDTQEGILDDQEQHNAMVQAQHGDENPDDPNDHSQQYHIQTRDYISLKQLYKEAIKNAENEENVLLVLLSKIQDLIEKAEEGGETKVKSGAVSGSGARKTTNKKQKKNANATPASSSAPVIDDSSSSKSSGPVDAEAANSSTAAVSASNANEQQSTSNDKSAAAPQTAGKSAAGKARNNSAASSSNNNNNSSAQANNSSSSSSSSSSNATRKAIPKSTKAYLGDADAQAELMPGDKIAARVSGAADGDESFWILAAVVKELGNNRYEVEDEDPGDEDDPSPVRKHYKLPKSKILGLPKDFAAHKPYAKGTVVLAMFPDTTTFYPAIVDKPCSASNQYYQLKFEDDDDDGRIPNRKVRFSYVVQQHTKQ